jgi:hypothetical protein
MIFSARNQGRPRPGHCPDNPICPFSTFSQATAENKATTEQIGADQNWLAERGVYLSQWGPDAVSGKVKVHLTNYTGAARRILLNRYGDAIVVAPRSMSHPIGRGANPQPGDPS